MADRAWNLGDEGLELAPAPPAVIADDLPFEADHVVADLASARRFRALLGAEAWRSLPRPIRRRFECKAFGSASIVYRGLVTECRIAPLGRILGQMARLIGGPLPLHAETGVPATVCITHDASGSGQYWTRQYGRHAGPPQVIHSAKRFAGPTGIEEYLGMGFGIALTLAAHDGALYFLSDHYYWRAGPFRLRLPAWLAPGRLAIGHIDRGAGPDGHGRFAFTLRLRHRWFGLLVEQVAVFTDPDPLPGRMNVGDKQ